MNRLRKIYSRELTKFTFLSQNHGCTPGEEWALQQGLSAVPFGTAMPDRRGPRETTVCVTSEIGRGREKAKHGHDGESNRGRDCTLKYTFLLHHIALPTGPCVWAREYGHGHSRIRESSITQAWSAWSSENKEVCSAYMDKTLGSSFRAHS